MARSPCGRLPRLRFTLLPRRLVDASSFSAWCVWCCGCVSVNCTRLVRAGGSGDGCGNVRTAAAAAGACLVATSTSTGCASRIRSTSAHLLRYACGWQKRIAASALVASHQPVASRASRNSPSRRRVINNLLFIETITACALAAVHDAVARQCACRRR